MADTLIFKIDTTPTVSALQDVNDLLTQSKTKLKELTDAGKTQTDEYIAQAAVVKAYEKEQRSLNNVLVQQQGAIKVMTKLTEENIKAGKAENNSIAENRKAYNALYNQLIQTAKPTQEQIKTAKQLNEVLKEQEKALGNTSRNVGNYAEGFKEAAKDLNLFGVNIGGLSKGLEGAKAGFTAAGGGVKGFSAALATTGLPLIIMGVQALISAFETFKPVADAVEDAVTGISAAFKAFTTGGSMVDAYNQTKQYNDILRELEDTQKSFEVQQARYELQIERLALQSKNRNRSEQERRNLIKQANDLEVQSFNERQKRNAKEINNEANKFNILAKLNKADLIATLMGTKEEQKTFRERLEARGKFDEATFNKIQDLLLKRVSIERESISIREKLNNRDAALDDQITKEKGQELEKRQAAQEKAAASAKAAEEKAQTERVKAAEDEEDRLNKLADKNAFLEELRIKTLLSGQEQEEALFQLAFEKRFEDLVALNLNETQIEEIKQKELKAIRDKYSAEDKAKKEQEFNDKIAFNQKQLQLELNAVDLSVATEKEKERRKAEIQLAALEEQLKLTKQFLGPEGSLTKEQLQGITAIEQAIAKAKEGLKPKEGDPTVAKALGLDPKDIEQAQETLSQISKGLQAVTDIVNAGFETRLNNIDATKNAEIDAINQSTASEEDKAKKIQEIEREAAMARYDIELKQFQANKATSIIQTIINTAQAVMAQLLAPPPAGFIFAGLAAATGAAQLALIASQPAPPRPAFATGVIGLDGAGTATSDSIDARLSRGESVMTAKATERFAPVLAQMEMAVGNRPNFQLGNRKFATGYIPTTDGGYSDRAMSNEVNNASTMAKMFSDSIAKMPQPKLVYDEFTNFVNNRNQSVNLSEL